MFASMAIPALVASLFIGIDSPLGPLYLGGGTAEGGNQSVYIFLGQPFQRAGPGAPGPLELARCKPSS